MVLKAVVWLVLAILRLALEALKIFLLLFGLVARVFLTFVKAAVPDQRGQVIGMKKRFVLSVIAVMGIGCSGCGLPGAGEVERVVDVGISNEEVIDSSETGTFITEDVTVEPVLQIEESGEESSVDITESSESEEEPETSEGTETEVSEETETEETTEVTPKVTPEPTTETSTEAATEVPKEETTEEVAVPTTEELEEETFVAYDSNYVVALATEKTKAYGKILVWENLDRLLAEGKITQEEYDEYYPYDGLEDSYYSVFVETDLNKASSISGSLLVSEERIADYIARMLELETGPYFAISYAGIYEGTNGDFYEFSCHR